MFKILKTEGKARRGEFSCAHGGTVQTPVFMNVGTQAAISASRSSTRRAKAAMVQSSTVFPGRITRLKKQLGISPLRSSF